MLPKLADINIKIHSSGKYISTREKKKCSYFQEKFHKTTTILIKSEESPLLQCCCYNQRKNVFYKFFYCNPNDIT